MGGRWVQTTEGVVGPRVTCSEGETWAYLLLWVETGWMMGGWMDGWMAFKHLHIYILEHVLPNSGHALSCALCYSA